MNIISCPRSVGIRKEPAMWLCVDRIEGSTVVLLDDREIVYRLPCADYAALVGREPAESDILDAVIEDGRICSAVYDETETTRRLDAARARLNRLLGKH